MKPLNVKEIDEILGQVQLWMGARVQEFYSTDRDFILELYYRGETVFLWIDMSPAAPMLIILKSFPKYVQKKPSPAMLFAKAHLRGRHLNFAQRDLTNGRIVFLKFSGDGDARMEIRLFPHGQNILIFNENKKIFWSKPRPLGSPEENAIESSVPLDSTGRSGTELALEWEMARFELFDPKTPRNSIAESLSKKPDQNRSRHQDNLEKKIAIVQKLEEQLQKSQFKAWSDLGEVLKANQNLEVPEELFQLLDLKKDLAGNIQNCFLRAKIEKKKRDGLQNRIIILRAEIEKLTEIITNPTDGDLGKSELRDIQKPSQTKRPAGKGADSRISKFEGGLVLNVGKSAEDNIQLLRAAQPWDYWLHVRDVPGCHGILRRNRNQVVPDEIMRVAASRVVELTTKAARQFKSGDQFDVIVCEARFVKPIKGDRVGHVTIHNERTFRVRYTPSRPASD